MNRIKIAHLYLAIILVFFSAHAAQSSPEKNRSKNQVDKKKYQFVGNSFSKKFHLPECEFARKMNVYHVRLLENRNEALKMHYKACNWCMPKWTKSVSSKIIGGKKERNDSKVTSWPQSKSCR